MSSKPRSLGVQAHMMLFVLLAALGAAALGVLGLLQNRSSRALTDQLLADVYLARAAALVDMVHDGLLATTRAAELAGPQADAAAQADVRAELAGMQQTLASAQGLLLRGAADPAVRQADADLRPLIDRYARDAALLVEAALGGSADVPQLSRAVAADFKTLEPALAALSDLIEQQAGRRLVQRDALFADQRAWMLGVASVMVVGLVVVGRWFARSLLARLGAEPPLLGRLTQDIADGVLYSPLPGPPPAAGSVAAALLTMRDRLAETVAVIRDGADSVAIGSTQIAVGNHDLAERTARQAGSLQTAAQGMAGVTALLQQTATHAQSASALAAQSSVTAQRSGEAVQCLATTMTGIEAAGRLIAEISARIDGIATQTNILALNAAVEASRAGEQGQGFVAVAGEVRRLAQHTAAAAREIKGLVATSLAQLAEGSRQATDAGSRLAETMAQVDDVATLITAISRAAQAQSADMDQVGGSVSLLDQATQQNAALVEESAAAAAQLRDQAVRLADSVAVFRLRSAV